jgi:hypothetical protein
MNVFRSLVAVAVLVLVGGLTSVEARDKVLVPGYLPLTQEMVDLYREMWEWYCDIRLTAPQGRQYQQACISYWKKRPAIYYNQYALTNYRTVEREWRGIRNLAKADQARRRLEVREKWMSATRKDNDALSRFLTSVYDAAYKGGGTRNPILAAGDPPLTRAMIDLDHAVLEMLFDFPLSDEQRQKSTRLLIEEWKEMTQARRQDWARNLTTWAKLATYRNYERNLQRALVQSRLLDLFRKKDASDRARWLLAQYEAAWKPGSERNPVLVDGKPPLTQQRVDRYRDYLEVMLDLSLSGGFTAEERKVLRDHLVQDWKKMRAGDRDALLADLKTWSEAAAGGVVAEANQAIAVLRPRLLARLSAARDARSRWLLGLVKRERQKFELMSQIQRKVYETQMIIARNIGPGGTWEYNSATGRYDRWVPDR